jgi:hypothetical protein
MQARTHRRAISGAVLPRACAEDDHRRRADARLHPISGPSEPAPRRTRPTCGARCRRGSWR